MRFTLHTLDFIPGAPDIYRSLTPQPVRLWRPLCHPFVLETALELQWRALVIICNFAQPQNSDSTITYLLAWVLRTLVKHLNRGT